MMMVMMMTMMMFDHDETLTLSKVKSFWAELTRVHFINIRFFGISFDLHLFYYRIGLFQNQLFGL